MPPEAEDVEWLRKLIRLRSFQEISCQESPTWLGGEAVKPISRALEAAPDDLEWRSFVLKGSSSMALLSSSSSDRMEELAGRLEAAGKSDRLSRRDLSQIFILCRPRSAFCSSEAWDIANALFIRFWEDGADESAATKLMNADWLWRVGHAGDSPLSWLFYGEVMDEHCNTHTAMAETASYALAAAALRTRASQAKARIPFSKAGRAPEPGASASECQLLPS